MAKFVPIKRDLSMYYLLGLKQLPFQQDLHQIIYVESEYNFEVNDYIRENYKYITDSFQKKGYEFCYIPALTKELFKPEIIYYHAPYIKNELEGDSQLKSDFILDWMVNPINKKNIKPSLLFYHPLSFESDYVGAVCQFHGITLEDSGFRETNNLSNILDLIQQRMYFYSSRQIKFHLGPPYEPDEDEIFDDEQLKLMEEIEERVRKLELSGIKRYVVTKRITDNYDEKISRIIIKNDCSIVLKDYDKTIKLYPESMALFILFLRHEEGIEVVNLDQHREELKDIYMRFKTNPSAGDTIDDITKTTNRKTIYEKCAEIRKEFKKVFATHIVEHYCITGERYSARKITLDRKLVECEDEWILKPYFE